MTHLPNAPVVPTPTRAVSSVAEKGLTMWSAAPASNASAINVVQLAADPHAVAFLTSP